MTKILPIVNPYAAWRAECCKIDINQGWYDNDKFSEEDRNEARKAYYREYRRQHKDEINAKRRAKKAARDCNHKAASKKIFTKSIAI
jgi:hypothetical protein